MARDRDLELATAEGILEEVLIFNAEAPNMPRKQRNAGRELLDMKIEHFLRRDEPESGYYGKFDKED